MYRVYRTLKLLIVLFLLSISLVATATTTKTTTNKTTAKRQVTAAPYVKQTTTTNAAVSTPTIIKKQVTAPPRANQTTTAKTTVPARLPDLILTSSTTTEATSTDSLLDAISISDCDINNFEYTSYQNSINVSWDDCGSSYKLDLFRTIYDGPDIPYIRWLNDSSSYHFENLEECTAYNVSIEPDSGIQFQATIRTLPGEAQDVMSTIERGKITFNWSEPIFGDCKRYSVLLNDELQPQLRINTFPTAYNRSRCTKFELALVNGENNTGTYLEKIVPGVVENLATTALANSITVTWETPVEASCVVGYTVFLNERAVNTSGYTYTSNSLEACTTYAVGVAAYSDTDYGENTTVSQRTNNPTTISAVRNMYLQVLEDVLRVTWDPPNLQGACVTRYGVVMWNQFDDTFDYFTTETFHEFTPLVGCMTYTVMVKPMVGVNDGVSTTQETKISAKVNTAPNPTSITPNRTSVEIDLKLQAYSANMCNITKVIVNCTNVESNGVVTQEQDHVDLQTRVATVELGDLLPYTKYECYAYVENPASISNASDLIEFRTLEGIPSSPINLTSVEDDEGLLITWEEPEEAPGEQVNYLIAIVPVAPLHVIPEDCDVPLRTLANTTSVWYRYTDFLAHYEYNITVAASIGNNIGPEKSTTIETAPQVPEVPQNVTAKLEIVRSSEDILYNLTITWSVPCKINGQLIRFGWELESKNIQSEEVTNRSDTMDPNEDNGTDYGLEFSNLLPYHNYTFRLAAYVQNGTNEIKGEEYVFAFTTEDGIPSSPRNLTVIEDEKGLLITWEEPEDIPGMLGNYTITITPIEPLYDISEDCSISVETFRNTTAGVEYRYRDILAYYYYNISVAASIGDNIGPENSTTFETAPQEPELPLNVTPAVQIINPNNISLFITWSNPCKINGNLDRFEWVLDGVHLESGNPSPQNGRITSHETGDYGLEILDLLPYHNYTFRLAAYVGNDTHEIKGKEYVYTFRTPDGYPSAPTNLRFENITSTGFEILWDEPSQKNGEILFYSITIDTNGPLHTIPTGCTAENKTNYNYTTNSNTSSLPFEYGQPNFEYVITMVANTSAGFGNESMSKTNTRSAESEVVRDIQLNITNILGEIYDASVKATWLLPCNTNGDLKYFAWTLEGISLDNETDTYNASGYTPSLYAYGEAFDLTLYELQPMFVYNFSLAACVEDVDIICGEVTTTEFETPDGYASPPTDIAVRNRTAFSGILEWGEPGAKNGEIQMYIVEIIPNGPAYYIPPGCSIEVATPYVANLSSTTLEFSFEGLPNYNYTATVVAVTRAGIGYEGDLNFTLDSIPSQPPRELNFYIQNYESVNYNASITFTWVLPCHMYGKLQSFLWIITGQSLDDGTHHGDSEVIPAKHESEIDYIFTINNLRPLYVYQFSLAAIVSGKVPIIGDGPIIGEGYNITFETPDGYPSEPFDLRVTDLTSDSAVILWDEPRNKNGRIQNYRVVVTSTGPVYHLPPACPLNFEPILYNVTVDPEIRDYAILGRPNFHYKIVVDAATRTDYGANATLDIITLAAAPQALENIKANVTDLKSETYVSYAMISFDKPCELNALFLHYSVDISGMRDGHNNDEHMLIIENFENTSFILELKPEFQYYGHIDVVTTTHKSTRTIPDFSSPAGVPMPSTAIIDVLQLLPNSASIILSNQMFDQTVGNIIYYAVIINEGIDNSEGLGGGFQFLSSPNSWPDTGYYGDSTEYQATPKFWNPFSERVTNHTYIIGNENCSINSSSYCNGPLTPDTQYAVRVRGFTTHAFRDTTVAYFTTPAEETYLALILGLVFGILAAIILLVFIFLLWRRKKKQKGEDPQEETVIEISKPPPIPKNKFVDHCLIFEEERSHLKAEYSYLDRLSAAEKPSSVIAMAENNKRKNRYINIMPYDETRVRLETDNNDNYEDYINASYIKGYSRTPEYIATQGPMESTLEDFWRMIIQENVGVIVMVAQFVEQSKQKCFKYFPEKEEIMSIGRDINVKCTNEINLNYYITRTLIVEKDGQQMSIRHLQYILWPDFGCPTDTSSMLEFREVMRKNAEMTKNKVVIHCSAGVGRTGTLIAIDILLQKIDNSDDDIDVFGTVLDLRKQRTHMVQTEKQYDYIHKCLREYLTRPKHISDDGKLYENLGPIYENVNVINGYTAISRSPGPHTSTENLIRLKEL
ncbi:hypothetical protein Trydic_g2614 [Trypoxylus dichotomus]